MKLEDQVCSLDLAKKLKELGVKQEAFFFHVSYRNLGVLEDGIYDSAMMNSAKEAGWNFQVESAAFTVAELGEMLPPTIDGKYNDKTRWFNSRKTSKACVWYENARPDEEIMIVADTEANARAKMLVYLIENNLLKVESINQPES